MALRATVPGERKHYRIRRATLRDLDALVRQRRGMWRDIGDRTEEELDAADPVYRRWARQRMNSGKLVAFVAQAGDGRVVAGGAVWLRDVQPRPGVRHRQEPYLLSMYTEPEHRGKGLATRIVREAIRWAASKGYRVLILHASDEGRAIYEKLGFRPTTEMRFRLRLARRRRRR